MHIALPLGMPEVGSRDEVVISEQSQKLRNPGIVWIGRHVALTQEIVLRPHTKGSLSEPLCVTCVLLTTQDAGFHSLQPERNPATSSLQMNDTQGGMPLQYAAHDEGDAGHHVSNNERGRTHAYRPGSKVVACRVQG